MGAAAPDDARGRAPVSRIGVEVVGGVATLLVDNPPVNSLSEAVLTSLDDTLVTLAADLTIGAVVVAANGPVFLSGGDLHEIRQLLDDPRAAEAHVALTARVLGRLSSLGQPVVAAVQGPAVGGGFEVTLACDLVVVDERASFRLPEVGLGLMPGAGGTQRLTRLVGRRRATEIVLFGRKIGAEEAVWLGLATRVAPSGQSRAVAEEMAAQLASSSRSAVAAALGSIRAAEPPAGEGLELERRAFLQLLSGPDAREGTAAFFEKRAPRFAR